MVATRRSNVPGDQNPEVPILEDPQVVVEAGIDPIEAPAEEEPEQPNIQPNAQPELRQEEIQGGFVLGDFINQFNQMRSVLDRLVEQSNANQRSESTRPESNQRPVRENQATLVPPRQVVSYCPEENRLDPMTSKGQKLILEISKPSIESGKTLQITQKNGTAILKHVIALSQKIDFRTVLEINVNGTNRSILRSHDRITSDDIRRHNFSTSGCWGYDGTQGVTPYAVSIAEDLYNSVDEMRKVKAQRQLDLRTRNQILQRFISNLCDAGDLERIKIRNADILEVKNPDDVGSKMIDGTVLLKIVLDKCSPSTLSKIDNVKSELAAMKMSEYNDNVEQLIDEFEAKVLMIEDMGGQVEEKFKYLFRALQTSTNDDFNQDIRTMRMKYYRGDGKSFEELTRAANDLYKNMVADDAWGKKSEKDLHIAALTTKLSHLTEITKALASSLDNATKTNHVEKEDRPDWKFAFKGDSLEHNGRTYFWCPDPSHSKTKDQKVPGMYCLSHGNGSGISHEESRKRVADKRKSANAPSKNASKPAPSTNPENQEKLALSDKLKAAISSHLTISPDDLDSLFEEQQVN